MLLPPKIGSEPIKLPSNIRQVTIIGANGCGKTRFAHYLAQQLKPKAFILSAIGALCEPNDRENQDGTIDAIYRGSSRQPDIPSRRRTHHIRAAHDSAAQ